MAYGMASRTLLGTRERRQPAVRLGMALAGLVVGAGALLAVTPFVWMVFSSFKTPSELFCFPATLLPAGWDLASFSHALERFPFLRCAANSMVQSLGVVFGQIVLSSMAAYSLSKLRPRHSRFMLMLIVSTLMIPFESILVPLYLQVRAFPLGSAGLPHLNLLNTYWALILPNMVSAFNIFVLKGFFDRLPEELLYSARIDGCGEWTIFSRIVFPLSVPILTVLGIFGFIASWNSFFWPLIAVNSPDIYTLMLGVQKLIEGGEPWNIVMAAVTLTTLPTLFLFLLLQRWIVRGIVFTGLQS